MRPPISRTIRKTITNTTSTAVAVAAQSGSIIDRNSGPVMRSPKRAMAAAKMKDSAEVSSREAPRIQPVTPEISSRRPAMMSNGVT